MAKMVSCNNLRYFPNMLRRLLKITKPLISEEKHFMKEMKNALR